MFDSSRLFLGENRGRHHGDDESCAAHGRREMAAFDHPS